jgi:CO/xanthine dehydrogenase Mo-binding subunit
MMPDPVAKLPHELPLTQPRYVGKDVPRVEDPLLLTGRVEYGDNIQLPGMLHAAILRSPHAHARIISIDTSRAEALPGVAAVLTGEEVKAWSHPVFGVPEGWTGYALATEKVHWVGEPVAVVAASDRYVAEDACELIDVEYEVLAPILDPERAMAGGPFVLEGKESNVAYTRHFQFGDIEKAFGEADLVVKERFRWHRTSGNPMETCVCIADWDPFTNMLTVRGSHRSPHLILPALVFSLGMPSHQIRIVQSPLGGSFGVKTFARYIILISLMAKKLGGRAVKWTEDRIEHLRGNSSHAWDREHDCELAVKRDGTILGLRMRMVDDFGAFAEWLGVGMVLKPMISFSGCYKIDCFDYECFAVLTNKVPQGPYRGFGLPSHYWVLEQLIDMAAAQLGIDRVEMRRKNFVPMDAFPYTLPSGNIYDSGNYAGSLDLLLEKSGYADLQKECEQARAEGRLVGLSVVSSIEPGLTGPPMLVHLSPRIFTRTASPEGVLVRMDAFGKVIVEVGFPWGGQSQHTFVRQIVADYFSIAPEDVQVITVDSLTMQPGTGPISSSVAIALSGAVMGGLIRLAEKLKQGAAVMLEVHVDDIELFDGQLRVRGVPDKAVPVQRVAGFMQMRPDRLPEGVDSSTEATYVWNPPDRLLPDEQGRGTYSVTAAGALHLCMLEIDRDTGQVQILKYVMVDDCGTRLNPSVVSGMLQGGLAHGIGNALLEEYVYDENGQLLSSNYMDYLLPTIKDVPMAEEYPMVTPSPITALGVKGIGEAAIHTTPAAVLCAINNALEPLGARITEAPATPLRLWSIIQGAQA